MNVTKKVRSILWFGLLMFTVTSCDFIVENDKEPIKATNDKITRIETNKKEAKLLVQISKNNFSILEICETIEDSKTEFNVKRLAKNLEKKHLEISKSYSDLAREKLISIANDQNINNDIEITALDSTFFITTSLELISSKIEKQINLLDTLTIMTDNVDFKVLAIRNNYILKANKSAVAYTLNELNKPI